MRWTIAKKLSYGFWGILALLVLGSTITLWQQWQVLHAQRVSACRAQETHASYEILSAVGQLNGALRGYIIARLNNDPDETTRLHKMIDQLWSEVDAAEATLGQLDPALRSADVTERMPRLMADLQETRRAQYEYLRLEESGDEGAHQASLSINVNSLLWAEKVRIGARGLVDSVAAASARDNRRALFMSTLALFSFVLITVSIGTITTAAAVLAGRWLRTTVPEMISHAQRIASGELEMGENTEHADDEIGDLDRSFTQMVRYLREMAAHSEAIAAGNLDIHIEPRSNGDALSHAFVKMRGGLEGLVVEGRGQASDLAQASSRVAQASQELARVGEQAADRVNDVSGTMQEMSASLQNMVEGARQQTKRVEQASASAMQMAAAVDLIAGRATGLLQLCERSSAEAASGVSVMERTEQGLHRIGQATKTAQESRKALEQRTDTIRRASAFIEELAEQTNLLALNAAIEAARAGERGAGFGVLADELTKLARRSAESAHEIAGEVQEIQQETARSEQLGEQSTTAVAEGLQLADELRLALGHLAQAVNDVYRHAQEIDHATRQQASGSNQVAQAAGALNQLTQEMASAIEQQATATHHVVRFMDALRGGSMEIRSHSGELAASASQMADMSQRMLRLMERFVVPGQQAEKEYAAQSANRTPRRAESLPAVPASIPRRLAPQSRGRLSPV
jgi:methyl-accepting chemotaxis protein